MVLSKFRISLLLLSLMSFVSCGDLFMKKDGDAETTTQQFSQCELDTQALSNIFTKNIEAELLCLGQNLNLFIDVVKTDRPGNLSLKELKLYIDKHINDIDPSIVEALDVVFETNSLILGDDKEYIARDNVNKLINLLIDINQVMVENTIISFFASDEKVSLREHNYRKSKVFMAFSYISTKLKQVQVVKDNYSSLNLLNAIRVFRSEENAETLDKVTSILFLKKIFLGGEKEILTTKEFQKLAGMMADGGKIAYDIAQFSNITIEEDQYEDALLTLKENFEAIVRSLGNGPQKNTKVMHLSDVINAINQFIPGAKKYTKYFDQFLKLKEILLESSDPEFSATEVKKLFETIILENLKRSAFFYRSFKINEDILTSGKVIKNDLTNFFYLDEGEKKFKKDFNQVVRSYRYFRGQDLISTYTKSVIRSPLKMIEVTILENIAKSFFRFYGTKDTKANGGYKLSFDQLALFMKDLRPVLEGEKLIEPNRIGPASETIFMISGLFQSHSDGDLEIEMNEIVQFLLTILTSLEVQKVMYPEIEKICQIDPLGRYEANCFRDNFLHLMQLETPKAIKLADHFPKMVDFLKELPAKKQRNYIIGAETIARACIEHEGKEIPMTEGDIFLVFSGLASIEQTMIRLDANNDNILEPKELDKAFQIYEDAIKALIPGNFMKRFAKSFFLYLVRYRKVPDVTDINGWGDYWRATKAGAHFFKFLLSPKKYTPADRQTLLSIIQTLQSYSESEPFPCEILLK